MTLAFKPRFNLRHENSILMYVILLVSKSKDKLEDMDWSSLNYLSLLLMGHELPLTVAREFPQLSSPLHAFAKMSPLAPRQALALLHELLWTVAMVPAQLSAALQLSATNNRSTIDEFA